MPSKNIDLSVVVDRIEQISNQREAGENNLLLIGGCSRSGKSTLALALKASLLSRGITTVLVQADWWLVPASNRPAGSAVTQRYRMEELSNSIMRLLSSEPIDVIPYDSRTRELSPKVLNIKPPISPFILIVEGVITLAVDMLREISALNLFVEVGDCSRVRRLVRFYGDLKMLSKLEYKKIIKERECEEVPFIKSTRAFADMVLVPQGNQYYLIV